MLGKRILTGTIGAILFLTCIFLGSWYMVALFGGILLIGCQEITAMKGDRKDIFSSAVTMLLGVALLVYRTPFAGGWWSHLDFYTILEYSLFVLLIWTVVTRNQTDFRSIAYDLCGGMFLGLGLHDALMLRFLPFVGLSWFLLFILTVWVTDTAAFFVGGRVGGPKLWPSISPNKTMSGAVGGVIASILLAIGFSLVLHQTGPFHVGITVLVAIVTSVSGQVGDFVESALKRSLGVKDSGTILPGHGGVLDRFDSLIFAAPVAYHFIVWSLQMR